MHGTLSDRAKELFKNPLKAKLLMDYILSNNSRKHIYIGVKGDKIIIALLTPPTTKE